MVSIGLETHAFTKEHTREILRLFAPSLLLIAISSSFIPWNDESAFVSGLFGVMNIAFCLAFAWNIISTWYATESALKHQTLSVESARRIAAGDLWRMVRAMILAGSIGIAILMAAALLASVLFAALFPALARPLLIAIGIAAALALFSALGSALYNTFYLCAIEKKGAVESVLQSIAMSKPYRLSLIWRIKISQLVFIVRSIFTPPIFLALLATALFYWATKNEADTFLISTLRSVIAFAYTLFIQAGEVHIALRYAHALKEHA